MVGLLYGNRGKNEKKKREKMKRKSEERREKWPATMGRWGPPLKSPFLD